MLASRDGIPRVVMLAAAATFAALMGPGLARADYPERDIHFIVPFSAGGGSDIVARNIVNALAAEKLLPVSVLVDNRPGGGGSVGYSYLASRNGDPYFIGTVAISFFTTPLLGDSPVNYKDFQPVAAIATDPYVMAVRKGGDITSLDDVKSRKRIVVGSSAAVSDAALIANMLARDLEIEASVVPFDGDGEVLSALLGGHVDVTFSNLSEIMPQLRAGDVTAIAITSGERAPQLPDIPTFKELGLDYEVSNLRGVIMPKDVPAEAVQYWEDKLRDLAASDYWKENYLDRFTVLPDFKDKDEFGKEIETINARYEKLMKDMGIIK